MWWRVCLGRRRIEVGMRLGVGLWGLLFLGGCASVEGVAVLDRNEVSRSGNYRTMSECLFRKWSADRQGKIDYALFTCTRSATLRLEGDAGAGQVRIAAGADGGSVVVNGTPEMLRAITSYLDACER
ncbi:MAG: hypothetical protein HQL96_15865 [Magnetococcales bacterium]|nr:hypothetical protein [Magnetococcales bacterium]